MSCGILHGWSWFQQTGNSNDEAITESEWEDDSVKREEEAFPGGKKQSWSELVQVGSLELDAQLL